MGEVGPGLLEADVTARTKAEMPSVRLKIPTVYKDINMGRNRGKI